MINLNRPAQEIAAQIKQAVLSDQPELLLMVAEHARSGYRSWAASKQSRRGDSLHGLLVKSIMSLHKNRGVAPVFDEIVKGLWEADSNDDPAIIDISGTHGFVIWKDNQGEYQKTGFRLIQKRIDRILKKLDLPAKA